MASTPASGSDPDENSDNSNSSSDEQEQDQNIKTRTNMKISEYEKQRLERIKQNKERMEALGIRNLATSLTGSLKKDVKKASKGKEKGKGKGKKYVDEEYVPEEEKESDVSEADDEEEDDDGEEEEEGVGGSSATRRSLKRKGKNTCKLKKIKMKLPVENNINGPDFFGEDEAIQQAIALSLSESSEFSGGIHKRTPQQSNKKIVDVYPCERKGKGQTPENDGRKKRRKQNTNRVGMTADQLIFHFFNFDETGKGIITFKDLRRVANAHDFSWTDVEMADMIRCFDCDGDGKLNLADFQKIVSRCNMIQTSDNVMKR